MHFSALEADCAIGGGKEGVVSSYADIGSGEEFRTALPDDDGAGGDLLAAKAFDASVLGVAVSSVSCRALSLFMCHSKSLSILTCIKFAKVIV